MAGTAAVARAGSAGAGAARVPKFGPGAKPSGRKASDVLPGPPEPRAGARPAPEPATEPSTPAAQDAGGGFGSGLAQGAREGARLPRRRISIRSDGSGLLLGFLLWSWVVGPYIDGGTKGITDLLRAKFLNQGPDGSELP